MKFFHTFTAAGLSRRPRLRPRSRPTFPAPARRFPYPIYAKWADAYKKETGIGLNYQSIGSGGGIKQIKAKTVTFGATRHAAARQGARRQRPRPVPDGDGRHRAGRQHRGLKPGELTLDGPTLAKIFLGEIKSWDDAAIAKLNPSAKLPSQAIVVVHRSDGSGTTFIFTDYLAEVSADWKSKIGVNTAVEWPAGIGAKGNEGVANNVAQTKGCDRLCRVCLCQAEQADLHQAHQQGRQGGRSCRRGIPGRRRQRGLGGDSRVSA